MITAAIEKDLKENSYVLPKLVDEGDLANGLKL